MKQNLIQVLDIAGTPEVCYDFDSVDTLKKLYQGQLLKITRVGLVDISSSGEGDEKFRFVVAKNPEERDILLKVEPVRCYLRDHLMNSKVVELNPYQSVRWLRGLVEKERGLPVTLIVNQQVLTEDSESLINHISENCIIHVLQNQHPQKLLAVLYAKEPGSQSQIYRMENIATQGTIEELSKQISSITSIPYENLLLVYGGRILAKDRKIADCRLLSNGIVYAVDQKKFMKKVTKDQFQTRVQEIRKSKQSYKQLMSKIKSTHPQKGPQSEGQSPCKAEVKPVTIKTKVQEAPRQQIFSATLQKKPKEEPVNLYASTQQIMEKKSEGVDHNLGTPPNSPIYIFNRLDSYKSVNSQLKEGRVITKETDVYEDPYGYVHEHSKEKTLFKNGGTKIVDVDIAEDGEGNVVKIEKDIVSIKRDPKTGNTIKIETDIIEDGTNKTIVKKEEVRDQEGNLIKEDTEVIKNESGKKETRKHERGIVRHGDDLMEVNTEILEDGKGNPYKIETDITETKDDGRGHTNEHSKDIKQENGVTSVIERNVMRDKEGNIMETKTDIIKITEDQEGNIYKHEHNEIDSVNRKVIIERDIVTNPQGEVISKETNMKVVEEDANSNVIKHETDVIEESDGRAIVIEKSTVQDPEGNIIKSESEVFQLNKDDIKEPREIEIIKQAPEAVEIEGQREPLINGGRQVSIDELGNTHTHEKQLIEKEGKTTFVDRDTIEDPRGKVIRVETDIVEIEGKDDGNMHKHKSEIIEQEGKITMVETDQIVDIDGILIRKEKDTIEIQGGEDGSVFKHEKDIIEEDGKTKIIERDIVEDAEGNVIKSQTKVTEVVDKEDTVEVHEKQELIEAIQGDELEGNQQVERETEVVQDEDGNIMRREQQVTEDESGSKTFVDRCTIENADGQVVREQTEVINVSDDGPNPQIHRHVVDYSEQDNKVKIEQSISKQNVRGQVLRTQTQTIQIQQCEDGTVKKREMEVVEENGKKVVHVRNTVEDQTGRIISKDSDLVELQAITAQNMPLPQDSQYNEGEVDSIQRVNVERKYEVDREGNTITIETEVRNSEGHETQIQRQFTSNPEGQVIKTETGILDVQERGDGSTKLTAIDIVQEGNVVTIVQNDSIQDAEGNEVRTESGTLRIKELQGGVTKKEKENIIEEGGIRLRVEKETYEDSEGNILQEKVKTTQLVDKFDEEGNSQIVAEGFKRKEEEIRQDSSGNIHFYQRQIIDNEEGKTTLVETEVVRNEQNQLLKATTDVIEMTELEDGNVHRREVNIIEKPGKVTVAESNAVENAQGERLQGEVESVVVTEGPNGEIIKKETGIIMEDCQKTIVEKTIVEDSQGNIIKSETTKKRIYTDASGVEQGRDIQVYNTKEIQIGGDPSTIQKQIKVDVDGNVETTERLTTVKEDGDKKVVEVVDVKVLEGQDGSIVDQSMNVTKIVRNEDGQVEITETNVPIENSFGQYEQVESEIKNQNQSRVSEVQREMVEDEQGNLHTFEKEVIDKGEGNQTVIKSETIQSPEGHLITINTNVANTEQLGDGKVLVHTTQITSGDKVVTSETYTIQNQDGSILSEKTKKVEVSEDDGLIKTNRVDILREDGLITINNTETLEDQDGHVIDQSSNKLEIQDTEEAVREQARKVARAELMGEVTGIVKQMREDEQGNMHLIETETIEDHGKKITIDTETVENRDGQIIKAQTDILEEEVLDNGKVEKHKTVITEKGGRVQVVQYSEIKEDEGNLEGLNEERVRAQGGEEEDQKNNLFDELEGGAINQGAQGVEIEMKEYRQADQQKEIRNEEINLLDSSLENSSKRISQLPLESRKIILPSESGQGGQQTNKASIIREAQEFLQGNKTESIGPQVTGAKVERHLPEEYDITLISKEGERRQVRVRYDEIVDEVAEKLSAQVGSSKDFIKMYLDGAELADYQMISELGIEPGSEVYFSVL